MLRPQVAPLMAETTSSRTPKKPPVETVTPTGAVTPARFVPPLYFMQAIPVALVQEMSVIVFQNLGVDNSLVATSTSLIALPWSFKLLWGPIVDLNSTKRRWVLMMQLIIAAAIIATAFVLQLPNFFGIALGVLMVVAIFSATCDIATDGFYLLATTREQQAKFVGWQSGFFRLGRLFVIGGLVKLAGYLMEGRGMEPAQAWGTVFVLLGIVYGGGRLVNQFLLPKPEQDEWRYVEPEENRRNVGRLVSTVAFGGFLFYTLGALFRLIGNFIATQILLPRGIELERWILVEKELRIFFVPLGVMSGETADLIRLAVGIAGVLLCGGVAWKTIRGTDMGAAFGTFFGQSKILGILFFMLFFRFSEAMLIRVAPLFLLDDENGLGFTTDTLGTLNSFFGVPAIIAGGIVGGFFVSKLGLRKSFIPLILAINLPNIGYVWASYAMPGFAPIAAITFLDQFGYGFGFAGYLVCLMQIAQRNPQYRTAHYAIGTGLGALFITVAGITSGLLMGIFEFQVVFWVILIFAIPGVMTMWFVPLDKTEGRGTDLRGSDTKDA